ncbi:MAG: hypothetical protein WB471_07150 [Nocardioides sp.]
MTEPDRAYASTPGPDVPARHGFWSTLQRWRTPLVVIPLLLGLGYSGAVGARLLWADVTPTPAAAAIVTCWDGSEAVAAECPDPAGLAGLRWVFPSFRQAAEGCSKVTYPDTGVPRPLEYACKVRVRGGRASVNYSERSDLERGLRYFDQRYPDIRPVRTAGGARLIYSSSTPRKDGSYEVTVALTTYPFAVTVSAATERLRDAALEKRVTYRADRFLSVQPPPEQGPDSAGS